MHFYFRHYIFANVYIDLDLFEEFHANYEDYK